MLGGADHVVCGIHRCSVGSTDTTTSGLRWTEADHKADPPWLDLMSNFWGSVHEGGFGNSWWTRGGPDYIRLAHPHVFAPTCFNDIRKASRRLAVVCISLTSIPNSVIVLAISGDRPETMVSHPINRVAFVILSN